MFALTARIDYAIKGMTFLAECGEETVKCEVIAQARGVPLPFLRAIFTDLKRAGLVGSLRGANGGHWLLRPVHDISLFDIISAVEPINQPIGNSDGVDKVWQHIHHCEIQILKSVSIADLIDPVSVNPANPIQIN